VKRSLPAFAGALCALALLPVAQAAATDIPGQYIVTLTDGKSAKKFASDNGAKAKYVYAAALDGFAARLSDKQVEKLRKHSDVVSVEPDQEVSASAVQAGATWGLDRSDQRALPLSGTYSYTSVASNVTAYVIDTGIYTAHADFGGRATNVYDAFGGNGQDCNGHGTHVAGTIGGTTYGVAKAVKLRGVRVLDCKGSGTYSGIIAGIDWIRANHVKPAVANMSLGGSKSTALNNAVTNLINAGVFTAVAAGNENQNACNVSPASTAAAVTVAASDQTDTRASFSNYGSCVDTYAPGVSVTSAWSNGATNTISGTSMASPHVAGVGALYKATHGDAAASTVASWINSNATANVIKSNPSGTANRLLFKSTL
jgi:subtilisin family serine protease